MCSGPSQRLSFLHCFMRSQKEHGKAASGSLVGHRGDGVEIAEGEQPATAGFSRWGLLRGTAGSSWCVYHSPLGVPCSLSLVERKPGGFVKVSLPNLLITARPRT